MPMTANVASMPFVMATGSESGDHFSQAGTQTLAFERKKPLEHVMLKLGVSFSTKSVKLILHSKDISGSESH